MDSHQLIEDLQNFKLDKDSEETLSRAKQDLRTFLTKFPFKTEPSKIDTLTADNLYSSGGSDYFFLYVEHKTRPLGAIFTYGGKVYPNAVSKLERFKQLLRILVSPDLSISKKIDADWDEIKGFGGDRLIAKKILYCYYADQILPIFKTDHLESFNSKLSIDIERGATERFGKSYERLTVGEKFELLNASLLYFRKQQAPSVDDQLFCRFLYTSFKTQRASTLPRRESAPRLILDCCSARLRSKKSCIYSRSFTKTSDIHTSRFFKPSFLML